MNSTNTKRIILVCRKAPYGNALAREALEIALAAAVYDQNLAIVFCGDGVWQLLENQNTETINSKNQQKLLSAFAMYDIDEIYVEDNALHSRNISPEELSIEATIINQKTIAALFDSADILLNF